MFNILANRNPWAKALIQTVVLTAGSGVWLAWASFTYTVKIGW